MWVFVMASSAAPVLLPVNQFDHFYRGGNRIGARFGKQRKQLERGRHGSAVTPEPAAGKPSQQKAILLSAT